MWAYRLGWRELPRLLLAEVESIQAKGSRCQLLERALRCSADSPLASTTSVDPNARRRQATQAELLEQVDHAGLTAGDARRATRRRAGLDVDNLDEGLWRLAMQAESWLGLREPVGHRYEQLQRLLDEQVGLEPKGDTRTLRRELSRQLWAGLRAPCRGENPKRSR